MLRELALSEAVENLVSLDLQASKQASRFSKALHSIRLIAIAWMKLFSHDLVFLNASNKRAIVSGFMLDIACRMHRKPLVIRIFGGAFLEHIEAAPTWRQWMARRLLKRRPILLQTRFSIDRVRAAFPDADLRWFPNSRPLQASSEADPRRPGSIERPLRFYFAGHVCADKGADLLLELANDYEGPTIEIHLFGELLGDIDRATIDRSGSADCSLFYHGAVPNEELAEQLPEFDALLFPTRFVGEGYPGVILEAFSHGLPVIASDWYAIPELVDADCGALLPHDDVDSWRRCVHDLAEERERVPALSRGARARIHRFDSAEWNRRRLPELLTDIMAEQNSQ
ncbi:glycosyltransferase family 4 protein [Wenzhouxiangella sp. EGI_FJ10409]|uniref:glycosyltransferase family 4 protein n=1 Tax=Wenzhouxiangella sp. EGI_FJ10409 TaxID=3243767 RepID=UPI0035E2FEA3